MCLCVRDVRVRVEGARDAISLSTLLPGPNVCVCVCQHCAAGWQTSRGLAHSFRSHHRYHPPRQFLKISFVCLFAPSRGQRGKRNSVDSIFAVAEAHSAVTLKVSRRVFVCWFCLRSRHHSTQFLLFSRYKVTRFTFSIDFRTPTMHRASRKTVLQTHTHDSSLQHCSPDSDEHANKDGRNHFCDRGKRASIVGR